MNENFCWFHQGVGRMAAAVEGLDGCPACQRRQRIINALARGAFDQVTAEEIESIRYPIDRGGMSGSDIERAVARGINNRGSY